MTHLLVEIEIAPADGTTHIPLPPIVKAFPVVTMSTGCHSRLLSFPVLHQANRTLLYVFADTFVVGHRHEQLQVAKGQFETRTTMKDTISIATQGACEAKW